MNLLAFALANIGIICLSLSLKRHAQQIWPEHQPVFLKPMLLRLSGYSCLCLSALVCILYSGFPIGTTLWIAIMAASALIQAMLLTYWVKGIAWFCGISLIMLVGSALLLWLS